MCMYNTGTCRGGLLMPKVPHNTTAVRSLHITGVIYIFRYLFMQSYTPPLWIRVMYLGETHKNKVCIFIE